MARSSRFDVAGVRPDGSEQSIADDMQDAGLVKAYLGGLKGGWC